MENIYFIIIALFVIAYIVHDVRKKKLSIKESFWWIIASLLMLILAIFPYSIDYVAKLLNVAYPPTLLFVLCIVFLFFINFKDSKRIAEQQEKIIELEQNLAILKSQFKKKSNDK